MADLERVFSELIRVETMLWNAVDARLRSEFDLPLSRYEPMRIMAHRGSCRVNDIANDLVITIGGTSKLIDRIEASGHCERRPNPDDGRSSIIALTPAGKRLLTRATQALNDELTTRLDAALSPRMLDQFAASLTKLRAAGNIDETSDSAAS